MSRRESRHPTTTKIQVSGKTLQVPSAEISGWTVVVTGRWLRVATLKDEELVEGDPVQDATCLVEELKNSQIQVDILSLAQPITAITPKLPDHFDWDNRAAVPITSFEQWWSKLPQESRKNVRRAAKRGVVVKVANFDDKFVGGICGIYNETPTRQGRRFWHYGKDAATVKSEIGTYLDRSDFIAAYVNMEMIGFIKITYVDTVAVITQILAKNAHHDARPMNAMLASAIELCQERGMSFLIYGKYIYGRHKKSLLTEFKRRNCFEEIRVPRYFIPLTSRGRLAIALRLYAGLRDQLPAPVIDLLLRLRSAAYRLYITCLRAGVA